MEENQRSKFKFSGDDDAPEAIRQDELRELKMEKLGHRVTLLTILIPCMIGVIMVIAYLDIKDRVTRSQDTGTIGVQKLSKDLASKFSSLSLEQAKIRDIQAKKLPKLEKDAAFLRSKLSKLQKSVTQMSQSMITRDELARVVDNLNQKVSEVPQSLTADLETLASNVAALGSVDEQMAAEGNKRQAAIASHSNSLSAIKTDMDTLRQKITNLGDAAIDKGELELALKLKEIAYRQLLLDKTTQLEKEIQILRNRIQKLQGGKQPSQPAAQKPLKPEPGQQPADDKPETPSSPPPANAEPGGIVEQTIE